MGKEERRKPQVHRFGYCKNAMCQVLNLMVSRSVSQSSLAKYKRLIVSGFIAQRGLGQKMYLKYCVSLCPPAAVTIQI